MLPTDLSRSARANNKNFGNGWLRDHAKPDSTVDLSKGITSDDTSLAAGTGVVNGGPRLLSGGATEILAYTEGFHRPEDPEFYYRFGIRRNPRTLAGLTPEGNPLLVAVDGPTTASALASRRALLSRSRSGPMKPSTWTVGGHHNDRRRPAPQPPVRHYRSAP